MARKTAGAVSNTKQFEGMEDLTPEPVRKAADVYLKALRDKNKASEKAKTAKETCIEVMKEHECTRIRVDDGEKWLVLEETDTLKTEPIKGDKGGEE